MCLQILTGDFPNRSYDTLWIFFLLTEARTAASALTETRQGVTPNLCLIPQDSWLKSSASSSALILHWVFSPTSSTYPLLKTFSTATCSRHLLAFTALLTAPPATAAPAIHLSEQQRPTEIGCGPQASHPSTFKFSRNHIIKSKHGIGEMNFSDMF